MILWNLTYTSSRLKVSLHDCNYNFAGPTLKSKYVYTFFPTQPLGRPSDEGYSIKQRRLLGNCFYACIIWCMDSLNAQVSIKCVFSFGNSEHFRTFNTTAQLSRIMVKIFLCLRFWFTNILWFIFSPKQFLLRPIKVAYNWVQKVCNWFCFVYREGYYPLTAGNDVIVVSKVHFSKVLYLSVVSSICSLFPEKMQYVCQSNHEKVSLNPCFRPQLTNISRRLWLWKPPDNTNGPDL